MVDFSKAIIIAMILFSLYSALQVISEDNLEKIVQNTNITTTEKAGYFWLWSITLNDLVPTIRYQVPFIDGYIVPVNDLPYFDPVDLIIMLPLVVPASWFVINRWKKKKGDKIMLFGLLILWIFVSFLIAKFIIYQLYLYSSERIGLTVEEAIKIREAFLKNSKNVGGLLFIISVLSGAGFINEALSKK